MDIELETDKLVVPVIPDSVGNLPLSMQNYFYEMHTYLEALHRDLNKLRSAVNVTV